MAKKLKMSAIVVCWNEIDYIKYCLESIKDIVDEVIICDGGSTDGTQEVILETLLERGERPKASWPRIKFKRGLLIEDTKRDNYAYIRNLCLEECKGDWILVLDGDEIFANRDGSPVTKEQLQNIIKEVEPWTDSLDIFTRHFFYNYFTLDARHAVTKNDVTEPQHFSWNRLFRNVTDAEYIMPMHERLKQRSKWADEGRLHTLGDPIIWHFGGCKSMEATRRKYRQAMRIFPTHGFFSNFKDADEYCSQHELFRGTRPTVHYPGPMPKVMKLW